MPPKALAWVLGSLAIVSAATLLLPLVLWDGLAKGSDVLLHTGNVVECAYLLREGRLPVLDWLPDIAGGRGGPNYIYYGTVGFIGPALLVNLGLTPEDAIRVWTGLVFVVGFLSAALFASTVGGWLGGLAAGVLFVFGPYFFSLPYSRAGYPEHMAYALYPLAFYFAGRAAGEKGLWPIGACSAVFAVIVATHTLSLAVLTPFLVAYFLLAGNASPWRRRLFRCAALLATSAVLLAPWWIGPALERGKVLVDQQLRSAEAARSYAGFGVPWHSLFNQWFQGSIVSRCVPGRIHLLSVLAAILVVAISGNPQLRKLACLRLALALAALVLVEQSVARACVKLFPGFAYLQFPWRLLAIFNLFASASFAACLSQESPLSKGWRLVLAAVIPLACATIYFPQIPPQRVCGLSTRTREGIRASMTTLDHENKYMPAGAKTFQEPAPRVLLVVPGGECFETEVRANDYRYVATAGSPCPATFHQYFFDGWKAEVDERPVPVGRDPSGLCQVELPEGVHRVRLYFVRTPIRQAAILVSGAGWIALLIAAILGVWRRCRRGSRWRSGSSTPPLA